MFSLLTKYLLQFKKVAIPQVGYFELVVHPATYQFAERLIHPATYKARFTPQDNVAAHQINYLATATGLDEAAVFNQLDHLGITLKKQIQQHVFEWQGIGQLKWSDNSGIVFHPVDITPLGLQPVNANKVLREKVQHTILVGDREVHTSGSEPADRLIYQPVKKRRMILWIAGIVAALAIGFIVYHFYTNGLKTSASGYQQKVNASTPQPTYAPKP